MKTGTIQLGNASLHIGYTQIVPPNKRGLAREITEFQVKADNRGKGEGTELLKEVCKEADDKGIVLIISPDNIRLERFYAKFGFKTIQDFGVILMARPPIKELVTT